MNDTNQQDQQQPSGVPDITQVTDNSSASSNTPPSATPPRPQADDELLAIKRSALQELSPLLDHLDQAPEERFQTTMMMIQAADDKTLVPKAYEAAKQIQSDKERAQALLDIVNEINYFTRENHAAQSAEQTAE